jgi:hypothetical protein
MDNFKTYNEKTTKEITFTFGRMQPPTIGHEKLLNAVKRVGTEFRIYASQSQDPKKNPLDYKTKIKYLRDIFPQFKKQIQLDNSVKTALDVLFKLYDEGYTKVNFVVGGDRVRAFEFLKKYNGVKTKGKFYDFPDGIMILSAGERDPDAEGVTGMSASKMRAAAIEGDFKSFKNGIPGYPRIANLFNDLRKAMGYEPIKDLVEHIQLPPVSETREMYVRGEVLYQGFVFEHNDETYEVAECKPNFVVTTTGEKFFVNDIEF